jgi:chromosomal replication initiator protein
MIHSYTFTGYHLRALPSPKIDPLIRVLISEIQQTVAAYYRIPLMEMRSARRAREVARPRQVAMYLAKQLTPQSLTSIGDRFGGRDHTTVIHAVKQIEKLMLTDAELRNDVKRLTSCLGDL